MAQQATAVTDPRPPEDARTGQPPDAERARRARRRVTVELGVALAVAAVLPLTRFVDATTPWWLPAVQALSAVPLPPALFVLVLAALSRRPRLAMTAGLVALLHMPPLVGWWTVGDHVAGPGASDPLVVMAANLQYGTGDADAVVAAAEEHDVDVLILLEATRAAARAFTARGIDDRLPHGQIAPREDAGGLMVFSRFPLTTDDVPTVPRQLYTTRAFRVRAAADVVVLAAHPVPPLGRQVDVWHREVAALAQWADRVPDGTPVVVAGDFNAGHPHPVFRRFHAAGLRDAHREIGHGPALTWPSSRIGSLPIPRFADLDHVLMRGLDVADAGTAAVPGSDHDAVWAALVPQTSSPRPRG